MEWITVRRSDGEKKPSSVCKTRDSGFFIIDADGKVSGLMSDVLYGNLQNYCGPPNRLCGSWLGDLNGSGH